jgi:hypothetical protein
VYAGVCESTSGISYGALGLTYNSLQPAMCPFSSAREGDLSALSGALIEVVWIPSATVTGGGMILESDHCKSRGYVDAGGYHQETCNWGTAHGTSPLRFEVSKDVLDAAGNDNLTVLALPEGASTSQAFTIYVTLFEAAIPSGFTAIPELFP